MSRNNSVFNFTKCQFEMQIWFSPKKNVTLQTENKHIII